jgi:hypothetical protein
VTLLSEIRRDLDTLGEEAAGDHGNFSSPVNGPRHFGASDNSDNSASDSDTASRFGGAGGSRDARQA